MSFKNNDVALPETDAETEPKLRIKRQGENSIITADTERDVHEILHMLRYRRPYGGPTEQAFIANFIDPLPVPLKQDKIGNIYAIVGAENPTVLWSCHTDSVHHAEGEQHVVLDGDWARLPKKTKSNCLGSDDAAGVWLLTQMIKASVPGMYVFHFGEERGAIGSSWVAEHAPNYLNGIQAAIAFDRRNFHDVITHQRFSRSASDEFAQSLALMLPPGYKPSSNGIYTDTASYMEIVPECTNVSVGYFNEHGKDERLNIRHMLTLRDALLKIDTSKLIIQRDPKVMDLDDDWGLEWANGLHSFSGRTSTNGQGGIYTGKYGGKFALLGSGTGVEEDYEERFERSETGSTAAEPMPWADWGKPIPRTMAELLKEYPNSAADVLESMGFDVDDLFEEIVRMRGFN